MSERGKYKKKDLDYMPGCTLCEVGLVKRVDAIKKEHDISISAACKAISEEIIERYGVSLFSQKALANRYSRLIGQIREGLIKTSENKSDTTRAKKEAQSTDIVEENNSNNNRSDPDDNDYQEDPPSEDDWVSPEWNLEDEEDYEEEEKPAEKPPKDPPRAKATHDIGYTAQADRRLKAAKTLGIDYLYDLTRWSAMPAEILSFIKKTHAKKYHPDTGGSKEAYQAFEENLKILGEINE